MLVESDPKALVVLRANVAAVGLPGVEVLAVPVARRLWRDRPRRCSTSSSPTPRSPCPDAELAGVLRAALDGGWVAPGAVVVVERSARAGEFAWPPGLIGVRSRRYGEAELWYGRAATPDVLQGA